MIGLKGINPNQFLPIFLLNYCNILYSHIGFPGGSVVRNPPAMQERQIWSLSHWKQPRCPSADKWVRKLWYIYTMEYYLVIKKNELESVLMRWMKVEPIMQTEVSHKEKHQYSILMHICGI